MATSILFSHVGLFILVIAYCAVGEETVRSLFLKAKSKAKYHRLPSFHFNTCPLSGAKIFMDIEFEREMGERDAKMAKTDVSPDFSGLKLLLQEYSYHNGKYYSISYE